eukprot:GFYU01053902.1.p1 GENE.GFYU01053902.1~~GFYU01053902.1.p1  ORF type:complete len:312 (-),score=113.04 GFYU01053902.1:204-1085(-)
MPKEYICRLVLDRNHRSLMVFKGDTPVGGVCYRPELNQRFAEIAFLAITSSEQVKGYGTRLMNHLKELTKRDKIDHFLTYADNYAIGYFKKQGFSKVVTMPEARWRGYIKDYDGGTLMECKINMYVNYLDIPGMIKRQRAAIYERVKALSNSHVVHEGLDVFKEKRAIPIEEIKGVKEAGWKPPIIGNDLSTMQMLLKDVFREVKKNADAWPFQEPVDGAVVKDYYDIIKDPIDLSEIEKKLNTGVFYRTKNIFLADLKRMCANCRTYNPKDSEYFACADRLEAFVVNKISQI